MGWQVSIDSWILNWPRAISLLGSEDNTAGGGGLKAHRRPSKCLKVTHLSGSPVADWF